MSTRRTSMNWSRSVRTAITLALGGVLSSLGTSAESASVFDLDPHFWNEFLVPTGEVVTPHIKWAKPSNHKKIRALFIISRPSVRETVELAQRMDLDYRVFGVANGEFFDVPEFNERATERTAPDIVKHLNARTMELEKVLAEPYDLIVLGFVKWDTLPFSARYLILKKIHEGTPLLGNIIGPDEYLTRATKTKVTPDIKVLFPYKALPVFRKYPNFAEFVAGSVDVSQFGSGRIFQLKGFSGGGSESLTPGRTGGALDDTHQVEYDYYCAWIIHLMQYAVGYEPSFRIGGADYVAFDRDQRVPAKFTVESSRKKAVLCRFVIRDGINRVMIAQDRAVTLAAGKNDLSFDTSFLPTGAYYADLWVEDAGKIVDFGSSFIQVSSANSIAGIEINTAFRKEEPVSGKITLVTGSKSDDLSLVISREDNFSRVTDRKTIPLNGQPRVEFTFPAGDPLTVLQSVEVELRRDSEVMDRQRVFFTLSNLYLKPDDMVCSIWVWRAGGGYLALPFYEQLRLAGFDYVYACATTPPPESVRANLRFIPYVTRFADTKLNRPKNDHVRVPCLNDPSYREQQERILLDAARDNQPFSVKVISLGDETMFAPYHSTLEFCFCPFCVNKFHSFLKNEYQTLENLNREYRSNYKSFEEVQPVTLDEAGKDTRLAPLWVDYRRHMESTWQDMFRFLGESARKVCPDMEIGYESSDFMVNSFLAMGSDFYKMSQVVRLNNPYETVFAPHVVPDLAQPASLIGTGCIGACGSIQRNKVSNTFAPWHSLFHGANFLFVHMAAPGVGTQSAGSGMMAPDFSWYDFFKPGIAEFQELKRGIGKLILSVAKENDRTALLYSASSVHTATLVEHRTSLAMEAVLSGYVQLFKDDGRQFKVVAYRQVAEGILEREGYRFLILPYAQALSPPEAEQIISFVRNGGVVIADLRPGVCDEHGKPYPNGILDEVFGVRQNTQDFQSGKMEVAVNRQGMPAMYPRTVVDMSLKVTTGEAYGDAASVPAVIINQFGKGKAVLLNFSLDGSLDGNASAPRPGPHAATIGAFFRSLCVMAGMPWQTQANPELQGLRTYRFTSGRATYLGLMQDMPGLTYFWGDSDPNRLQTPGTTTITLPASSHIYNVREGKYLGRTSQIDASIPIGGAQLFALMPYKAEALQVKLPSKIKQGDNLEYKIAMQTDGPEAGLHVYHFILMAPDGSERECYTQNIRADKGIAEGTLTLALNEQPGRWKCVIKDVATGIKVEKQFKVKEK